MFIFDDFSTEKHKTNNNRQYFNIIGRNYNY
jgi:hypothetical protein